MISTLGFPMLVAFLIAYCFTPFVKKLALAAGAVDMPDERKIHSEPMPRLGGLAIYQAFVIAVLLAVPYSKDLFGILLGGTFIVVVGILDDIYQLPAKVKLLGQIASALVLIAFDIKVEWLSIPFAGEGEYIYFEYLSIPFTVFWVVAFTNVTNLIDGLDGLAAGVGAIASFTIACLAAQVGYMEPAMLSAALFGAIIGFIRYNFNPATIFMGDTGSMFIGYILAAFSVDGAVKTAATISLFVPAIVMGLPIMDTAFAIVRRYKNGRPIFSPDKGHLHHRLLALGMNQKQAVFFMYGITGVLAVAAVLYAELNGIYAAILIAIIATAVAVGARKIGIFEYRDDKNKTPEIEHKEYNFLIKK